MNAISGFGGFDPQAMLQKAKDNMQAADADNNGAISFAEAEASVNEKGGSTDMLNKMFEKGDANGDGELSEQEQQQMFAHMEEQMAKMKSMMSPAGSSGSGNFDSFQSLLDSLSNEDDEESTSSQYLDQLGHSYKYQNQAPIDLMA